nr:MAG TPA: putative nuclease [Caudoviricetes sp.]
MPPVEVTFRPESGYWLASCPSLKLMTQGKTFEEAKSNIKDALTLFFESCSRRGTLEEVLRENSN